MAVLNVSSICYFVFILQVYKLHRSSKTPTQRNWQSCYGYHTLCFTNMGLWPVFAYTLPFTIVNCSQGFHYPHYSTSSTTLHTTVLCYLLKTFRLLFISVMR
ncbi:uncharacterized protein LOC105667080 isoform X11 [Bombus terrestris]|uniref:Uncharacterized protein LOC105667080 isoform X11 n=1 Tax=Bombus terrestris TaxID=30195 RepID=A0A9C6SMH0_BOMTE|nr:uncharacterized protein LOC105667080 isoform X11 [Bombus terrestris]